MKGVIGYVAIFIFGISLGVVFGSIGPGGRIDDLGKQLAVARDSAVRLTEQNDSLTKINQSARERLDQLGGLVSTTKGDLDKFGDTIGDSIKIVRRLKVYFAESQAILNR